MGDDRLVVGHDGSAGADATLTTALGLAETLHSPVELVRALSVATAPRPADWAFGYVSSTDDLQRAVLDAAANLIELSGAARMVVTGSRGLGGVAELLLGSVSDEVVVRRARCPVLVTKEPAKP